MTPLAKLIEAARPQFGGTLEPIADAVGISLSALVRAMKRGGVLGTDNLIALAEAIGQKPDVVLEAAGKGDVAARLRRLYGTAPRPLSDLDRALVRLPVGKKRALRSLVGD